MSRSIVALDARLIGGTSTGDSSYWTGLLHGLSKLDTEVRFLLFSNATRPELIPDGPNFSWITVPASSSRWWSMVTFPLAARRAGARAIHTQYTLSPLVQKRGITTIHDVSFLIGPEWFKPIDRLILTQTVPASAKRAARIIAVSQTCKREIEQYIPGSKGKVAAIYNGLPPWVVRDPNPAPALRELGVSTSYLLTVGTQWPRKNMGLAIEAANLAEFPIVVTGKPGWGKKSELGHVKRVGYVSNQQLCSLYSGASLYLAPSLHEGFGIPLIEAFACGCPVLCSSGGALPEVAGDAAVVEPSWKAEVWAERIASLVGDSGNLSRMRERGLERVKQFDWVESARQTLDVYKEVAR